MNPIMWIRELRLFWVPSQVVELDANYQKWLKYCWLMIVFIDHRGIGCLVNYIDRGLVFLFGHDPFWVFFENTNVIRISQIDLQIESLDLSFSLTSRVRIIVLWCNLTPCRKNWEQLWVIIQGLYTHKISLRIVLKHHTCIQGLIRRCGWTTQKLHLWFLSRGYISLVDSRYKGIIFVPILICFISCQ